MPTTALMIDALLEMRHDPEGVSPDHFWQLVERFRADLVNQAFGILGNQADAEDVSQESLCEAYQQLKDLKDPRKLGAWLRKINRCNALDLWRKRKREREQVQSDGTGDTQGKLDPAAPETTPTGTNLDQSNRQRNAELVARAVDSLPELFRHVVILRYWEKKSYDQIAAWLDLPLGTVKSRIARADRLLVKKLRRLWAEQEGRSL